MAFHIKDPATDAAVRKLAAERGISLTAAVREAVENELKRRRRPLGRADRRDHQRVSELSADRPEGGQGLLR